MIVALLMEGEKLYKRTLQEAGVGILRLKEGAEARIVSHAERDMEKQGRLWEPVKLAIRRGF